jgi:hypothetical protein
MLGVVSRVFRRGEKWEETEGRDRMRNGRERGELTFQRHELFDSSRPFEIPRILPILRDFRMHFCESHSGVDLAVR